MKEPLSLWLVASKVETPTAVASVVISVPAPLSKYVSLNFERLLEIISILFEKCLTKNNRFGYNIKKST